MNKHKPYCGIVSLYLSLEIRSRLSSCSKSFAWHPKWIFHPTRHPQQNDNKYKRCKSYFPDKPNTLLLFIIHHRLPKHFHYHTLCQRSHPWSNHQHVQSIPSSLFWRKCLMSHFGKAWWAQGLSILQSATLEMTLWFSVLFFTFQVSLIVKTKWACMLILSHSSNPHIMGWFVTTYPGKNEKARA